MFSGLESSALRVSFWAGFCGSGGRAWRVFCGFVLFFCFFDFVYSQGSEGLTIWGVVWFCLKLVIIGLLSFSVRVLLFLFLQCAPFDGVDLLDSEAQILIFTDLFFAVRSF